MYPVVDEAALKRMVRTQRARQLAFIALAVVALRVRHRGGRHGSERRRALEAASAEEPDAIFRQRPADGELREVRQLVVQIRIGRCRLATLDVVRALEWRFVRP